MATDSYGSDDSFDVPLGVDTIFIKCNGGSGSDANADSSSSGGIDKSSNGEAGGYAEGDLNVSSGDTLYMRFPSGGNGGYETNSYSLLADGGNGGDGAMVHKNGTAESDIVIAAGGGGGGSAAAAHSVNNNDDADTDSPGQGGGSGGDGNDATADASSGDGSTASGGTGGAAGKLDGEDGEETNSSDSGEYIVGAAGGGGGGYDGGEGGNTSGNTSDAFDYAEIAASGAGGGDGYTGGVSNSTQTVGGTNNSGGSVILDYTTPVSDLSAAANTEDEIDLTWTAPSDASSFNLYRSESTGSTLADYSQIASSLSGGTESYTDTSREDGEQYYYRIETVDSDSNTATSNEADAISILPTPSLTRLDETSQGEITAEWDRPDDSSDGSWELYRSQDGSLGSQIFSTTTLSDQDYVDTGAPDNEVLYYTIRRVASDTNSETQEKTSTELESPDSIQVSVNTNDGDKLDVTWDDVSASEDGYRVYVASGVSGTTSLSWTQDSGDLSANTESYTTSALLDGELYRVAVGAFSGATEKINAPGLKDGP